MKCLGCDGLFKTEQGMIRHLSKKVFCQTVMGIAVPTIHPPTLTLPLDPQLLPTERTNKNKKQPAPPQLSSGLKPPPTNHSKKHTSAQLLSATSPPQALPAPMVDSHNRQSTLSGMLVDQGLLFEDLQQNAGQPYIDLEREDSTFPGLPVVEEEEDLVEEKDFLDAATEAHPPTIFQEGTTVFADHFDGVFTHAEKLSIRLLAILHRIGAPNYAFGEIMDIIADAQRHTVHLTSTFLDRSLTLNHLA